MSTFVKVTERGKGPAYINANLIRKVFACADGTASIRFLGDDGDSVAMFIEEAPGDVIRLIRIEERNKTLHLR